ncbi:hypothetical protein K439DRAFT_1410432 [Ramaria rubella]|nr:hypothetical protein K439DRAFT_1410432 [Ramaria rubella]
MPRKPLPGPSRLSQILKQLQQEPIPTLPALRSLSLTYAFRNDHFGARHFVKEDLPRIAYANPSLNIVLNKVEKKIQDTLTPELRMEFRDGSNFKISMENKWSSAIFNELLEAHNTRGAHLKIRAEPLVEKNDQRKRGEKAVRPHLTTQRTSSSRRLSFLR